jgi:cell division protein ZapA (FtsZ GTPase activity inhibitor)
MGDRVLNIKVSVDGILIPMKVADAEEEKEYRDAASLIQSRVQKLRAAYPSLNDKYYYAMAMLNTAVEIVRIYNRNETAPFLEAINDLEKEIDGVIKK